MKWTYIKRLFLILESINPMYQLMHRKVKTKILQKRELYLTKQGTQKDLLIYILLNQITNTLDYTL